MYHRGKTVPFRPRYLIPEELTALRQSNSIRYRNVLRTYTDEGGEKDLSFCRYLSRSNIIDNMEGDEREEGDPPRVARSTAKRARKVSLVDNAEASEVGISNDFLQKAKIIQENLRIYLTKADKSIKNKDQNHINGKIQWFIDAIESLEERTKQYKDKSEGLSLLVHKAVQETLTSPSVHSMITSIVIEKTVPKVIESLSGTTMKSNGPLAISGKSNEKSSATNVTPPEPLPAAVPFTVVKSKRNRKKTKKPGIDRAGVGGARKEL
ncbi:unnamed protein product [Nezara viridula]|uniref:Uncharacterized protein n=1 Tax=Nezara viridula TaxID=85310 RepID=A0A9P0E780_NEZVI|nr:unnamed protein product [Nezara viridula]